MSNHLAYSNSTRILRIPMWTRWVSLCVLPFVLIVPPAASVARGISTEWQTLVVPGWVLVSLWILAVIAVFASLIRPVRLFRFMRRDDPAYSLPRGVFWPVWIAAICVIVLGYNTIDPLYVSRAVIRRHEAAVDQIKKIKSAMFEYGHTHSSPLGVHYPPHLAALVAGGYLKPEDLIDPSSSTTPAKLRAGLVEADWPSIAAEIDAHSDFIYVAGDVVIDEALNKWAWEIILVYSKTEHWGRGGLAITRLNNGFFDDAEWARLKRETNLQRGRVFLPPIVWGAPPPLPIAPVYATLTGSPRDADFETWQRSITIRDAISAYNIDHDGHYPPHLAALVAGHYLVPRDLRPSQLSTSVKIQTARLTESDWPRIAADVDAMSHFIYLGGVRGANNGLILYTRYHPELKSVMVHERGEFPFDNHHRREVFVNENQERARASRPLIVPDVPLPIPAPAATIPGLPTNLDQAAMNREISSRNMRVVRAAYVANSAFHFPQLSNLISKRSIPPCNLLDPDMKTPLLDPYDPEFLSNKVEVYLDAHVDYIMKMPSPFALPRGFFILVCSRNTYNKTGRLCLLSDGNVRFIAWADLPEALQKEDAK